MNIRDVRKLAIKLIDSESDSIELQRTLAILHKYYKGIMDGDEKNYKK